MEYYLCEFEYGYEGQFYQVVDNGNVIDYVDLNNNQLTSMNSKLFKGLENLTHIWLNDNEWISNNIKVDKSQLIIS